MDVDKNYEKRGRVEVYSRSKSDSAAKKVNPHSRFLKTHFLAHQFFCRSGSDAIQLPLPVHHPALPLLQVHRLPPPVIAAATRPVMSAMQRSARKKRRRKSGRGSKML